MNWLTKALTSSVGKKYLMAITGLSLCLFLVVHLAGNLLLFAGQEAYDAYAHALHKNDGLLVIAEVGLFAIFVLHLGLAFVTSRENLAARDVEYATKKTKQPRRILQSGIWPANWMLVSGLMVLGFVVLHLIDFTFQWRPDINYTGKGPYDKAIDLLTSPLSMIGYLIGCSVLGFHLLHGFSSAFQSLGLSHPKYDAFLQRASLIFAVVIALGFISFVVWANGFEHPGH